MRRRLLAACARTLIRKPRESVGQLATLPERVRGAELARHWRAVTTERLDPAGAAEGQHAFPNPLRAYFDGVQEGPGVWKWLHYFELYHRHLQKFVGRAVTILEVGVYGGGSLSMWKHYFGAHCHVHGVDIQPACKAYENSHTTIHIGDQADRAFWKRIRESVPVLDVLIDDGGHRPEQQMVTLEEMLDHLTPGGVYICEDVHARSQHLDGFAAFAHAFAGELNAFTPKPPAKAASTASPFQSAIDSVHLYPFVVVIEKGTTTFEAFSAPRHGTQWPAYGQLPAGDKKCGN